MNQFTKGDRLPWVPCSNRFGVDGVDRADVCANVANKITSQEVILLGYV